MLDFSGGFAGSASKLTYNGVAGINGTRRELTNGGADQAGSVFSTSPVDVTKFTTQFTFQLTAGATRPTASPSRSRASARPPWALGGGLGYGLTTPAAPAASTTASRSSSTCTTTTARAPDSTGLYTNGVAPTNVGSIDLSPTGIDLHSGDVFQVNMTYDGTTLT